MHVCAGAPGKLVLCGEYAVLEGAPAVVLAVDRRCRVEVAGRMDATFRVDAPDLGVTGARACLTAGRLRWIGDSADPDGKLNLVTAILEQLYDQAAPREVAHVHIDTAAFFGPGGSKLGLGSSAAVTVALTAAMCAYHGYAQPDLQAMLAMHRRIQGGRGSGLDVAGSLRGGVIAYTLVRDEPRVEALDWSSQLAWRAIWSGRSASTGDALARLGAWQSRRGSAYAACMSDLCDAAGVVVQAFRRGDDTTILAGLADYAGRLDALGCQSGIDIVCAEHRALSALAGDCGVVYKSCGAGGGDVGVAIGRDPDALAHFCRRSAAAGFPVLDCAIDWHGLRVRPTDPRPVPAGDV